MRKAYSFILFLVVLAVIAAMHLWARSGQSSDQVISGCLALNAGDSKECCCSLNKFSEDDVPPNIPAPVAIADCSLSDTTAINGVYFGQESPGLTAKVFAPGIISRDGSFVVAIIFSPDGKECYFSERTPNWSASWIMVTEYKDGVWTTPHKASFSNQKSMCSSLSADGNKLFFSSNRGTDGKQGIFQCSRLTNGDWSEPVEMMRQISSTDDEWSCHLSDKGSMFVCSWRAGGKGKCDGWRIPFGEGQFQSAQNLGVLNTGFNDCGITPGPNEAYVIFQSDRDGGFGKMDLYISHALPDGKWSAPINLGPDINSAEGEGGAWVSYDGRFLFFSSTRGKTDNIYWVETRAFLTQQK